ncbi:MAG: acetyl-CoA carboxylase carboxyltransferase subunit beta [Aestuariivirgaceae bacterium]
MNWIKNFVRPKIRNILGTKKDVPDNMWVKCPETGQMVFYRDVEANNFVIPDSGHHLRMPPDARLNHMFGGQDYTLIDMPKVTDDPLKFRDQRRYTDRLKDARQKNEQDDAIRAAIGKMGGIEVVIAVQDFAFMGGSLGMAAGDAIITSMREAANRKCPYIFMIASGGARMQEGILSLMQLPRTTVGVQELRAAGSPYIVVLTNPTTGGVTASYAMLGDIQIAEPGALIGFAGQRVIEQTIGEKLPVGFQRAEYLQDHGMVDMVVRRSDIPATVSRLIRFVSGAPALTEPEAPEAAKVASDVEAPAVPDAGEPAQA